MTKIDHTIQYLLSTYPGAESWDRFVAERREEWEKRPDKDYFMVFFQNEGLAIVLAWHFDKHAFHWYDSTEIPALYSFSPRDLWNSGEKGQDSLRSYLMRTPAMRSCDD